MADVSKLTVPVNGENSTYDVKDRFERDKTKIYTGTCSTASTTIAKVATLDNGADFSLTTGVTIAILFQYYNAVSYPTLQVNYVDSSGTTITGSSITIGYRKSISGTVSTGDGAAYNTWGNYERVFFTYNGTYWVRDTAPEALGYYGYHAYLYNPTTDTAKTYPRIYGVSSSSASTAAKTVSMTASTGFTSSYGLNTGQLATVKFTYGHTAGIALSICMGNLTSTTYNKAVYYNGIPFTGVLVAGAVYHFIYDGTYWQILNPPANNDQVVISTVEPTSSTALIWIDPTAPEEYLEVQA